MKRTGKILISLLTLALMILSVASITVFSDNGTVIYLTPNSNWRADNAEFAMYTWADGKDFLWIDMTDPDGDGVFEAVLPDGYTNIIFCRMNPDRLQNGWSEDENGNKKTWNQTKDLTFDGTKNHYTISSGAWSKGEGSWSVFDGNACAHTYEKDVCTKCGEELYYIIAGNVMKNGDVYAEGDNSTLFVSKWDATDENNRMFYDEEIGCYLKIYENVAKGEYHFKIAENKSWDVSYGKDGGNCYLKVEEDGSTVVIAFNDGNVTCAASAIYDPDAPPVKDETTDDPTDPDDEQNDTEGGEESPTPDKGDEDEPEKLNFFQRLFKAIADFFRRLFGIK